MSGWTVLMCSMAEILLNNRKTVTCRDSALGPLRCHLHGNSAGLETWVKSTGMIKDKEYVLLLLHMLSHLVGPHHYSSVQRKNNELSHTHPLANHATLCQRALCCRAFLCQALILVWFLPHNSHRTGKC